MYIEEIIDKFSKVRRTRDGYRVICPVHIEKTPSLFISEVDGKVLLKCFGQGCKAEEIVDKVGLEMSDLFNEEIIRMTPAKEKVKKYKSIEDICSNFKTIEEKYEYKWLNDEQPSHLQIRYKTPEGKAFATFHRDGNDWYSGRGAGLTPLYNLHNIKNSKSILIVEGEKVVDILRKYGIPATTSLGGSNNAENTDWTFLVGKPSIAIWRDNDDPGIKYEESVSSILNRLNVNVRKVDVEKLGLTKGDDLEQYIELNSGTTEQIRVKIYSCIPKLEKITPVSFLKAHLDKVKKGEIKNWEVKFFPLLTKGVRMFKPGNQSVIVSAGGVGKSLFIGRTSDEFTLDGVARVKRLMLESPMSFHLSRSLAQQSKVTDVMNEEFHFENPEYSDKIVNEYEDVLNKVGETINTSDYNSSGGVKKQITEWDAKGVSNWMEQNAPHADLLVIDPVSIVLGDAPWLTSTMLTKKAEELMSKHPNLCVIWIQHTAESQSTGNVGGISGGKAWNRYTSTILEMVMLEDPEAYEIELLNRDVQVREIRTYIKVKKARNGPGNGWKIAIELDKNDLTYKEIGKIIRKVK